MKLCYLQALAIHCSCDQARGPTVCNSQGFQLFTVDLNVNCWEGLVEIWEKAPSLFGPDIKDEPDIEVFHNDFRSLCHGLDSRPIENGLLLMVINTVNCWHLVEKAGGSKPNHRVMAQYNADASLLKKVHHQYTYAM